MVRGQDGNDRTIKKWAQEGESMMGCTARRGPYKLDNEMQGIHA